MAAESPTCEFNYHAACAHSTSIAAQTSWRCRLAARKAVIQAGPSLDQFPIASGHERSVRDLQKQN